MEGRPPCCQLSSCYRPTKGGVHNPLVFLWTHSPKQCTHKPRSDQLYHVNMAAEASTQPQCTVDLSTNRHHEHTQVYTLWSTSKESASCEISQPVYGNSIHKLWAGGVPGVKFHKAAFLFHGKLVCNAESSRHTGPSRGQNSSCSVVA